MPDPRITEIEKLIADYHAADKDMTEANVEAAFVARLFAILGWAADDPTVWNRQVFVRGGGFADVGLQIQHEPVLLLEAKRFGKLKGPAKAVQAALFGEDVVLSQADRQRAGIDRTPEEKQAMRYARAQGVPWAALTNFERLVLFDANEERIILAFDTPEEYVSRFDDLKVLVPQPTPGQFDSHLNWYKGLQKKADVDADFFEFLSRWRVRLAQDIFDRDTERDEPLFHPPTSERLEQLMEAVQRVLDRLIILRYADDVGVLLQHDLLENLLAFHHGRLAYVQEYDFQREVNRLFHDFYRAHNTTIFAPGHICEQVLIGNECLVSLVREISSISFRKFSSDILGNTYESYLGQKLQLVDGQLLPEVRKDVRKGEGIYYTPGYIVRYIVDHTLGRWLYGEPSPPPPGLAATPLPLSQPNGRGGGGEGRKTLADRSAEPSSRAQAEGRSRRSLANLRVLDPAMGSGSFLIYAFDVLADFYERENARIEAENNAAMQAWSERAMKEGMFGKEGELPPPQLQPTVPNYIEKILQEHLYGVDLDPEAVEIAGVNLIMAAFRRLSRNRQPHRKLPLILRQNLKCGNSLISGDQGERISEEEYNEALVRLIQLRGELRELHDDAARAAKLAEIEAAAAPLNAALNESLRPYFGDEVAAKRPFNWAVEFPEAFDPRLPEGQRGFTVVVGNPPYGADFDSLAKSYLSKQFAVSMGKYESYTFFLERAISLLRMDGLTSYIVPNYWLTTTHARPLRELILSDTNILEMDVLTEDVFSEVQMDTMILVLRKLTGRRHTTQVNILAKNAPPTYLSEGRFEKSHRVNQQVWQENKDYVMNVLVSTQERDFLTKLSQGHPRLGDFTEISQGLTLYRYSTLAKRYGSERAREIVDKRLFHADSPKDETFKKELGGDEIGRYSSAWRGTWVSYGDWLAHKVDSRFFTGPRILVQKIRNPSLKRRLVATYLDDDTTYNAGVLLNVISHNCPYDLRYVLALLNSKTANYWYALNVTDVSIRVVDLKKVPIAHLDLSNPTEKAQHDALANLAQRMLELNRAKQEAERAFAGALRGYERETASLWRAYWDHVEYRPYLQRQPLLDANATGEVGAIAVDEEPAAQSLLFRAEVDGVWQDVACLVIPDEDLRLFLFFALRRFLYENRRKKVWARGRVLHGVLEALHVLVLVPASAAANLAHIAQLMADFRAQCPPQALHLSGLERALRETDAEIDCRVYDLYGLTEEERRVVEGKEQ